MKYLVKFFVITFLAFLCTYSLAEDSKVLFINLKVVLNESKAGKEAQEYLKKAARENVDEFNKIEDDLKKKEKDLIAKKNVLSKEEYKKMADNLRNEVRDFQAKRSEALQKIANQRNIARSQLVESLKPILEEYSKKNGSNIIMNTKDALYINPDLDVTKQITDILNKKLPTIKIN